MADQASVNAKAGVNSTTSANGRGVPIDSPFTEGVIGNLGILGSDITTLAELQAKLAVVDLQQTARCAKLPTTMLAVAGVLLLGTVLVAMIGMAELVADAMALAHRGWAYLIVAGVVLAMTVVLTHLAVPRLTKSFESFANSKEELARNVAWIKTVLTNSGRTPPQRR